MRPLPSSPQLIPVIAVSILVTPFAKSVGISAFSGFPGIRRRVVLYHLPPGISIPVLRRILILSAAARPSPLDFGAASPYNKYIPKHYGRHGLLEKGVHIYEPELFHQ